MSQATLLSIITNACVSAICFLWAFIGIAHWTRRHRPVHLVGTAAMAVLTVIFLLRTFTVGGVSFIYSFPIEGTFRWLWFLFALLSLVYTVIYLIERELHIRPSRKEDSHD